MSLFCYNKVIQCISECDFMKMYKENTANFYRNETDVNFVNYDNSFLYSGIIDSTMKFVEEFQLLSEEHWKRFVGQFLRDSDGPDAGWRGEFWGKMMRGACFVYSCTKNEKLYNDLLVVFCVVYIKNLKV